MTEQPTTPQVAPLPPHVLAGEGLAARPAEVGLVAQSVEDEPPSARDRKMWIVGVICAVLAAAAVFIINVAIQPLLDSYYGSLLQADGADKAAHDEWEGATYVLIGISLATAAIFFLVGLLCNRGGIHTNNRRTPRPAAYSFALNALGFIFASPLAVGLFLEGIRKFREVPWFDGVFVNVPMLLAFILAFIFTVKWLENPPPERRKRQKQHA